MQQNMKMLKYMQACNCNIYKKRMEACGKEYLKHGFP